MRTINSNQILTDVVKQLDLTATQFVQIERSYHALASELKKEHQGVNVYPQGSIRLGTIIRPYSEAKDTDFDVDLVAEYPIQKSSTTPKAVKDLVGNVLKNNETYKSKLIEKKRCWRIEYSELNGIGFHADISPSIPETNDVIERLKTSSDLHLLTAHSIAITHKDSDASQPIWNTSNPKGYAKWFENINKQGKEAEFNLKKQFFFAENRSLFNSVEEIPDALIKMPMQRVVQVLKRHRDVYFSRHKREDDKPISIIITTLVAEIVKSNDLSDLNFEDMLTRVCSILVKAEGLINNINFSNYEARKAIYRQNGKWEIPNPVNNGENFADAWNIAPGKANTFFEWLRAVERDIVSNTNKDDFEKKLCDSLAIAYNAPEQPKPVSKPITNDSKQPWSQHV